MFEFSQVFQVQLIQFLIKPYSPTKFYPEREEKI